MRQGEIGANPAPGFDEHPEYRIGIEKTSKRIRATFGGEVVADSIGAVLMCETRHLPVYYFPRRDVRLDLLARTKHNSYCPFKGQAVYWTLGAGGRTSENAVWSYENPFDEVRGIKDWMAFYWDKIDAWHEEDEEVLGSPRDPCVRVDILDSSRTVRVVLGGETVARSSRARFLFEAGLPTRYYIPQDDVRTELLEPSDRQTTCPYKGKASYYSVRIGGRLFEDAVWFYPSPLSEAARIEGYLCFDVAKSDAIYVDGKTTLAPQAGPS